MGKYSSMMCACAWLIIRVLGVWLGIEMIISECLVIQLYHSLLGYISCLQTYFYLEVSRHWKSYLQKSVTRKITGKYLHTVIAHKRKRIKIPTSFKNLDLLYHLMPSNTLALGQYELRI